MTILCCVIFKTPLSTFSTSRPGGYPTRGLLWAIAPVGYSLWLQAGTDSWLTLTSINLDSHAGICIYHFIMTMISDQLCDCFHLFTQVHPIQRNLWLTARSRVNMQQLYFILELQSTTELTKWSVGIKTIKMKIDHWIIHDFYTVPCTHNCQSSSLMNPDKLRLGPVQSQLWQRQDWSTIINQSYCTYWFSI